jgi:hypothetical protein
MSQEDRRSAPLGTPAGEPEKPGDATAPAGANSRDLAEKYREHRQAEREEEHRLERYEQTSSKDTTREKDE